jgi:hypothetical protein
MKIRMVCVRFFISLDMREFLNIQIIQVLKTKLEEVEKSLLEVQSGGLQDTAAYKELLDSKVSIELQLKEIINIV